MAKTDLGKFGEKARRDYVKLLDLLCRVLAADNDPSSFSDDKERTLIARGLTNKLVEHAVTVLYISRGTNLALPSFRFNFFDPASIDVLTRVVFEAFLIFHYVFYEPKTKEEKDYRYWCYKAAGIAERQNAPIYTEEHRQKQAVEREELDEVHEGLKLSAMFQSLTEGQKKQILKGKWKLKSWRELAVDAGLSEVLASHVYRLLSGRAHSSSLSVVQMIAGHVDREDKQAIISSMGTINVVIANMVRKYCGLFPRAQEVLNKDREGTIIVNWWILMGRTLDEVVK